MRLVLICGREGDEKDRLAGMRGLFIKHVIEDRSGVSRPQEIIRVPVKTLPRVGMVDFETINYRFSPIVTEVLSGKEVRDSWIRVYIRDD